jgi:hypothetical protein
MSSSLSSRRPVKRTHDSMSASKASSELMASLSSSLHQMLLNNPTAQPAAAATTPSQWLEDAMTKVGVSSNVAALKLWSDYGKENDEQFCNARYLVWVCQHVLFASHNDGASSLDELQSWQRAMEALVNNNNGGGGEEESDEMGGVMWEMLLRSLALTPDQLQSAYRKALEYNPHIRNIDDISYCFVWPSFFKGVVDEASDNNRQGGGKSKRRKGNHGNKLAMQQSNLTNTAWWPLLGYTITHAVLSASSSKNNTIQQKIGDSKGSQPSSNHW